MDELVRDAAHPFDVRSARRAVGQVLERPGALLAVRDPQRQLGRQLSEPLAGAHGASSASRPGAAEPDTTFCIAVRIRVFAVPSGISSIVLISRAV